MQCGYLKKAITSMFFVNKIFVRDYMPFRVNTNDFHQRDNIKKYIVSNCSEISFSSIIKGNLIYFFKYFFVADPFRLNLLTFRCAKLKRN